MALTKLDQPTVAENGQTFYSYPCKCEEQCSRYNPALTLPVKIRELNGQPKIIQRLNPCTHGGGLSCSSYKRNMIRRL